LVFFFSFLFYSVPLVVG